MGLNGNGRGIALIVPQCISVLPGGGFHRSRMGEWCLTSLSGTHLGLSSSYGKAQTLPLPQIRTGSGPCHCPVKAIF